MTSLPLFMLFVILLYGGMALFGPRKIRTPLLQASAEDWFIIPLCAAVVYVIVAI